MSERNRESIELTARVKLEEALKHLETLVNSLRSGTACIQQGDQIVVLHPEDVVEMELQARRKGRQQQFALRLSWERVEAPQRLQELIINDSVPELRENEAGELVRVADNGGGSSSRRSSSRKSSSGSRK